MQYIKTEGLLIDTVEKKAAILGNPNETISNNATTFLNGPDNTTENSSVSFLNSNTKTGSGSLSIATSNSTVSAKSFAFNTENSTISSNSISLNDSNSQLVNNSIGFLNQNENSNNSISILSRSNTTSNSSINVFSNSNQVNNNSISINSSNNTIIDKSVALNSLNSLLTSSLVYNATNVRLLSSFALNTNNSNLNSSVSFFGNNNKATNQSFIFSGNNNVAFNKSFLTLSDNITSDQNSSIFNSTNSTVSSNSFQIIGNNNYVDRNSISFQGNSNFVTNSSLNIGSNNKVYDSSLNIDGLNNTLSSNSIGLNATNSMFIDRSVGINAINTNISGYSISINSQNINSNLSSIDILGNNNTLNNKSFLINSLNSSATNNSIGFNSNNTNISNRSIVLNGNTNIADDSSLIISSEGSNALNKSLVIGGFQSSASLSGVSINTIRTTLTGNNTQAIGGSDNTFNSSNSIFLGGNNNIASVAPYNFNTGNNSILIGGSTHKIGSNSIMIGGNNNEVEGKNIVIGGSGNKIGPFENVVILNRNNVLANQSNIVYLPEINALGNLTISGNISAGGNITSISTLTANVSAFNVANYLFDIVPLNVNQFKSTVLETARFSYNNFPRLGINNNGVTINSFSIANNQALTVAGNVSATGIIQVNDRIQFGSGSETGGSIVRLRRSPSIANHLELNAGLILGEVPTNPANTNAVVVLSPQSQIQSRILNERVWDTNARFLSGGAINGILTNNSLVKSNGTNNTLVNSNISDTGSLIIMGVPTTFNGTLSVDGTSILNGDVIIGNNSLDTIHINSGPINIPNATADSDAIVIGNSVKIINSSTATLSTNANVIIGSLSENNNSNSIIVETNGKLEKRNLNPTSFNTTAPYVSAVSPNSFVVNRVLKAGDSSGITNSNITDNGTNVGINTTTPNQTLTVSGNLSARGTGVIETSSSSTAFRITQNGSGHALLIEHQTNDTTPFTITSAGFVGIGTPTITERLVVDGNTSISGELSSNQIITSGTVRVGNLQTNNSATSFVVHDNGTLQQRTVNNAALNTTSNFVSATNILTPNSIVRAVSSNGIVSSDTLFDNGTNIGIGALPNNQKLEVSGAVLVRGTTSSNQVSAATFDYQTGSARIVSWGRNTSDVGKFSIWSGVSGSNATEKFYINPSGNIRIGNSSEPLAKLDVQGDLRVETLNTGTTNSVVTHSSNILQTRNINPIVWNTTATLVSAAPTPTSNRLTKFSSPNTIENSSISDSNSLITLSTPIRCINGSATDVALQFDAANNTGLFFNSIDGLITNFTGQEKFRINANYIYTPTKLGIATTTFGSEVLNVNGNSSFNGTINSTGIIRSNSTIVGSSLSAVGTITATSFTGRFTNARTIELGGMASGSVSFDGSSNVTIPTTLNNGSISAVHLSGNQSGNAPIYGCRAWVNFDGTTAADVTGTWQRLANSSLVTITTTTPHNLKVAHIVRLDFNATVADGTYTVQTVISNTQFVITATGTTAASGTVTLLRRSIRGSGNVSSVTYLNSAGLYVVNFTEFMQDRNYCVTGMGRRGGDVGQAEASSQMSFSNQFEQYVYVGTQDNDTNTYLNSTHVCISVFR